MGKLLFTDLINRNTHGKFGVQKENCFIFPRVVTLKIDCMQDVLDANVADNS